MTDTKPDYYRGTTKCPHCGKSVDIDLIALALAIGMGGVELLVCKYVLRWGDKEGLKDLYKARECLDRIIKDAGGMVEHE